MPEPRTHARRKIVAIMAADVAGYSRLMARDEEGTYRALRSHFDELVVPTIAAFEGRAFKFIGDGVLAEFPSAVDALNCAATVQAAMAERNKEVPKKARLEFRIGLHVGDVIEQDGDLFGDGVNTAARVEGTAEPGGINVSSFVYESVRKKVPLEFEDLGEHMFKSFEEAVRVYKARGFVRPRTELRLGDTRERIAPGTRLNGIYEIDQLLAVGSTSEIYRARAVQTGDVVVIKALSPRLREDASGIAAVSAQASALYKLHHDAIARTFLFSIDEAVGQPYLAMEAVDGISLGDRVRHEPLSAEESDALRVRLAGGLAEAHGAGIVHRDLNPDNVILPDGDVGRAKIIEFQLDGVRPACEATVLADGSRMRSPFQSPEQLGHFGGEVGPLSDVYNLGLLLAFALKGEPLDADVSFPELIHRRRIEPDLSGIPSPAIPLLRAMLQPDPADRPQAMTEIAERRPRVSSVRGRTAIAAKPTRHRARGPLVAASLGVVVLAVGGGWLALGGLSGERAAPVTESGGIGSITAARQVATIGDAAAVDADVAPQPGARDAAASQPLPLLTQPASAPPFGDVTLAVLDGRADGPAGAASFAPIVDRLNDVPCFFASVASASDTALAVDMYAPEPDVIYRAYGRLKNAISIDPTVTGRLISDAQCAALDFARLGASTSPLAVDLKSQTIAEGELLDGTIRDLPADELLLLAVDPLGAVYDLSDGISPGPEGLHLLLAVNHPERGTVTNLLLAVSWSGGGGTVPRPRQGDPATDYLRDLARALSRTEAPLAIRLSHFVLRS